MAKVHLAILDMPMPLQACLSLIGIINYINPKSETKERGNCYAKRQTLIDDYLHCTAAISRRATNYLKDNGYVKSYKVYMSTDRYTPLWTNNYLHSDHLRHKQPIPKVGARVVNLDTHLKYMTLPKLFFKSKVISNNAKYWFMQLLKKQMHESVRFINPKEGKGYVTKKGEYKEARLENVIKELERLDLVEFKVFTSHKMKFKVRTFAGVYLRLKLAEAGRLNSDTIKKLRSMEPTWDMLAESELLAGFTAGGLNIAYAPVMDKLNEQDPKSSYLKPHFEYLEVPYNVPDVIDTRVNEVTQRICMGYLISEQLKQQAGNPEGYFVINQTDMRKALGYGQNTVTEFINDYVRHDLLEKLHTSTKYGTVLRFKYNEKIQRTSKGTMHRLNDGKFKEPEHGAPYQYSDVYRTVRLPKILLINGVLNVKAIISGWMAAYMQEFTTRSKKLTITEVSRRIGIKKENIIKAINELHKFGFVRKKIVSKDQYKFLHMNNYQMHRLICQKVKSYKLLSPFTFFLGNVDGVTKKDLNFKLDINGMNPEAANTVQQFFISYEINKLYKHSPVKEEGSSPREVSTLWKSSVQTCFASQQSPTNFVGSDRIDIQSLEDSQQIFNVVQSIQTSHNLCKSQDTSIPLVDMSKTEMEQSTADKKQKNEKQLTSSDDTLSRTSEKSKKKSRRKNRAKKHGSSSIIQLDKLVCLMSDPKYSTADFGSMGKKKICGTLSEAYSVFGAAVSHLLVSGTKNIKKREKAKALAKKLTNKQLLTMLRNYMGKCRNGYKALMRYILCMASNYCGRDDFTFDFIQATTMCLKGILQTGGATDFQVLRDKLTEVGGDVVAGDVKFTKTDLFKTIKELDKLEYYGDDNVSDALLDQLDLYKNSLVIVRKEHLYYNMQGVC